MKVISWLFGAKAGAVITGTWNWMLGKATEGGGEITVAVAEQNLKDMAKAVETISMAIATQWAAYEKAKKLVEGKQKEHDDFIKAARVYQRNGEGDKAKVQMMKAIQAENILPEFLEAVTRAEQAIMSNKRRLEAKQEELEAYKIKLDNMKDKVEVSKALEEVNKAFSMYDLDSAASSFDKAEASVNNRALKGEAVALLNENPALAASQEAKRLTAAEEAERRLAMLDAPEEQKLLDSGPQ